MFKIKLIPSRKDGQIKLEKQDLKLIVNGEVFDFSALVDGDILPRDAVLGDWLASDVARVGNDISLEVVLPHGSNAPIETRFPNPITVAQNGLIALPPYNSESGT